MTMPTPTPSSDDPPRRILSLWFPRLGAERLLRADPGAGQGPLAVVETRGAAQILTSLSEEASRAGLVGNMPLAEARALCPDLQTRQGEPVKEAGFLAALRRWAGRFSPWVAEDGAAALILDITGCAHLFGGEAQLLEQIDAETEALQLTACSGLADTVGAAWALARYAGRDAGGARRSGDAIDQEARATRSRASKRRHWTKGGAAPMAQLRPAQAARIAPHGQTRQALAELPVAALRLDAPVVAELNRLGLRRVQDLIGTPRATLARRFGTGLTRRLDQALGVEPEPITPAAPEVHFALRLSLPDPIGLEEDILAGIDRLLPPLCEKLTAKARGARRVRLELSLAEGSRQVIEIGLARATANADRIRPLLAMKLGGVEAGFGIDMMRLVAVVTEPLQARQMTGGTLATSVASARRARDTGIEDLMGRIGARVGLEAITRAHPAESHIPEKTATVLAAAWSEAAPDWPKPAYPRPLTLFAPEPVHADDCPDLPAQFRWRGRNFVTLGAMGPERIAPEWWLDDPAWRSGVRDYWRVETATGERLWLFYAHGGTMSAGWFCHGDFA